MSETVELRPFPPFLPPQARVIMMGSFPPAQEKRAMDFHYPNFNNDMWRVYGLIFFNDKDYFRKEGEKAFDAEKIKSFLSAKGIASCPSVVRAIREKGNASDKFLKVVETVNLEELLSQIPRCHHIITTGGKATEILLSLIKDAPPVPKTGETVTFHCSGREVSLARLPSTSRAYPLSLEKKATAYEAFFRSVGMIG